MRFELEKLLNAHRVYRFYEAALPQQAVGRVGRFLDRLADASGISAEAIDAMMREARGSDTGASARQENARRRLIITTALGRLENEARIQGRPDIAACCSVEKARKLMECEDAHQLAHRASERLYNLPKAVKGREENVEAKKFVLDLYHIFTNAGGLGMWGNNAGRKKDGPFFRFLDVAFDNLDDPTGRPNKEYLVNALVKDGKIVPRPRGRPKRGPPNTKKHRI